MICIKYIEYVTFKISAITDMVCLEKSSFEQYKLILSSSGHAGNKIRYKLR